LCALELIPVTRTDIQTSSHFGRLMQRHLITDPKMVGRKHKITIFQPVLRCHVISSVAVNSFDSQSGCYLVAAHFPCGMHSEHCTDDAPPTPGALRLAIRILPRYIAIDYVRHGARIFQNSEY
jgi:hypothetical protein